MLDLSCRRYEDGYYIMTDRWQNKTNVRLTTETMLMLQDYCDEFLVHAVDVEGRQNGVERELVSFLGHEKYLSGHLRRWYPFHGGSRLSGVGRGRRD